MLVFIVCHAGLFVVSGRSNLKLGQLNLYMRIHHYNYNDKMAKHHYGANVHNVNHNRPLVALYRAIRVELALHGCGL